ncbi:MAG: hypothetical protein ABIF19_09195 [Planctomycetota bacterium]
MTSEKDDFDAKTFVDEGMEAAGIEPEETEDVEHEERVVSKTEDDKGEQPKKEEKETATDDVQAALESTQEEEAEDVESAIEKLFPKDEEPEKPEQRVPLEDHIKLRQRAQQAERERDELRQRLQTPTGAEKPGTEELSPIEKWAEENPDDAELSPPPTTVQIAERKWQEARFNRARQAEAETQRQAQETAAEKQKRLADAKALEQKATMAEKDFKKGHKDYDRVTGAVVNANLLTDAERRAIFEEDNPAEAFYTVCKKKLAAIQAGLGIEAPASQSTKKANEEEEEDENEPMTEDEIFESVYGKEE